MHALKWKVEFFTLPRTDIYIVASTEVMWVVLLLLSSSYTNINVYCRNLINIVEKIKITYNPTSIKFHSVFPIFFSVYMLQFIF